MAVLYQAQGAIAASTGADVTPVNPAHASGDILIAHVFYRSQTPTTLTPAGWTLLSGPYDGNASTRHYWFWLRASGAAETNPLMDKSAATGDTYARVYNIRGAWAGGNPFEAVQASAHDTSDPFAATGVTSLSANALIFVMVGESDDTANDFIVTATDPAGPFPKDTDVSITGSDALMGRAGASRATAGDTGNININWQDPPEGGAVLVVAIGDSSAAVNVSITSVKATATAAAGVPPSAGGPENVSVTSVKAAATAASASPAPKLSVAPAAAAASASAASPTLSFFVDGSIFDIPGPPPTIIYAGTNKAVYAQFKDPDGVFFAPDAVSFKTRHPDGTMTTYVYDDDVEVENDAYGVYHVTFEVTAPGVWTVAAKGEDEDAVGQVEFYVTPSVFS